MTASSPVDGVRALAAAAAQSVGLVLEGVTITPAGRRRVLRVVVDLPDDEAGGVPMERVASASQALSSALDGSPVMGGSPYVLEVSSPGIDRPLTEPRHWRRARGRLVRVTLGDGREVTGRVDSAAADVVVIAAETIPWHVLGPGRIQVEFNHPDGVADDEALDVADDEALDADDEALDADEGDGLDDEEGRA